MRPDPRPASVEEILAHADWVRRLALGLVGNEAGADDLTQEALMRAIERPPVAGSSVKAWFARVVRNLAIDQGRKRQRRVAREWKVVEGKAGPCAGDEPKVAQPSDIQARLEMQEQLAQAVRELPEPYRTTTVMYYFDQLGTEEIAARLGLQSSTVRNQLSRARARLRDRLERRFGADWKAMCIALFLRPSSQPVPPPPPPGVPAGLAGAMAAGVLLVGAWMAASALAPTPLEGAEHDVEAVLPSAATVDLQEPVRSAVAPVRQAAAPQLGGLMLTDEHGDPVSDATVRVYGVRWQGMGLRYVGPERNQFHRYPLLETAQADAQGFVALETLSSEGSVHEPRIACVVEAPGFRKRVESFDCTLDQPMRRESVLLAQAGYAAVRVVDAHGRPIPEATVSVRSKSGLAREGDFQRVSAQTAANGEVALATVPPEATQLMVSCPGYRRAIEDFTVAAERPEEPRVVMLERGGEASVAVYAWDGQPFGGAEVYLDQGGGDQRAARWTWSDSFVGRTRDDGSLAFGGIDEQRRCHLVVRIDGVEIRTREILPGDHVDVNLPPLTRISGRVVQHDGQPASHALVGSYNIEGEDKRAVSHAWTDPSGAFALTVEAGLHGVGFWHRSGSLVDEFPRRLEPGDVELGDVRLPEGRSIIVEVLEADGSPVLSDVDLLMRKPLAIASSDQAIEPGEWREFLSMGAKTTLPYPMPGGRFLVTHLPPGPHAYSVYSKRHQPSMLTLDARTSPDVVRVRLERAVPVRLALSDERGKPFAGRRVTLFRADHDWHWAERRPPVPQPSSPSTERTDARGVVEFGRIAPGEWVLAHDGEGPLGLEITRVTIPEQGVDLDVVVPDPARLTIALADASDMPEGAQVSVHTAAMRVGAPGARQDVAWADAGASMQIAARAGEQTIDVALPGSLPRSQTVDVGAGGSTEVEVDAEGTDVLGRFPQATRMGRVILVPDDASRMPDRDVLIAALRDGVHQELGGHLPLPDGSGRGLPYATTRVSELGAFLFSRIPNGRYRLYGTAPKLQLSGPVLIGVKDGRVRIANREEQPLLRAIRDAEAQVELKGLASFLASHPKATVALTVRREVPHPQSSFNESRSFRMRPERQAPEFQMEKEPAGRYFFKLRALSPEGVVHLSHDFVIETVEGERMDRTVNVSQGN